MQVESGKLVLEEADFDLRRELEGLVDMFSVQCDQAIDIVLDLDGRELCSVSKLSKIVSIKFPKVWFNLPCIWF